MDFGLNISLFAPLLFLVYLLCQFLCPPLSVPVWFRRNLPSGPVWSSAPVPNLSHLCSIGPAHFVYIVSVIPFAPVGFGCQVYWLGPCPLVLLVPCVLSFDYLKDCWVSFCFPSLKFCALCMWVHGNLTRLSYSSREWDSSFVFFTTNVSRCCHLNENISFLWGYLHPYQEKMWTSPRQQFNVQQMSRIST